MPMIQVLPKHIADLIAAGEVVEQPASVVKELLENAIDAGASVITLEITDGGKTYIRITDNGCGIGRSDIRAAFTSHATSKIREADDLDAIATLGFRGEALASICAVSKVDVLTRTVDESVGTHYIVEGGAEKMLDDAGCPVGTTIAVRQLFYNVPARMKFLKKDIGEGNAVASTAQRLCLSHPEVAFKFIREGKTAFQTAGDGKLLNTLSALFGHENRDRMTEISYNRDGIAVRGLVSLPHFSRGSRAMQFFFVNNRTVKSPVMTAAFEEAYKNMITVGKFPAGALFVELPFDAVDVNVHPAKTEVRFQDDRRVFDCVYNGVKNAVFAPEPAKPSFSGASIFRQLPDTGKQVPMASGGYTIRTYGMPVTGGENELHSPDPPAFDFLSGAPLPPGIKKRLDDEGVFAEPVPEGQTASEETPSVTENGTQSDEMRFDADFSDLFILGEVYGVYVLVKYGGRLYIADKHAAHERILFNELKANKGQAVVQIMLQSVVVHLSAAEYAAVTENLELLTDAGFDITDFGDMTVSVKGCPVALCSEDVAVVVTEIAAHLVMGGKEANPEKLDWIYHNTACRAAVKAGNPLSEDALKALMVRVFSDGDVRYCPHGRPVVVEITKRELEKLFMRIQ